MFLHRFIKVRAPEFPAGLTWLNSAPLTLKKLAGKPVLLDFWTYSCVNCLRTLPHLAAWHKAYAPLGLTVIGIHTPEFGFERDEAVVRENVERLGVAYPVVLDPQAQVWGLYANRYWPRSIVLDHRGVITHDHVGEGGYAETEMAIQRALREVGVADLPPVPPDMSPGGAVCYRTTPELYLGFLRGQIGNHGDALPDAEGEWQAPVEAADDVPYLQGFWRVAGEYVEHARQLAAPTGLLVLRYSAFGLNVVMGADAETEVVVELDGRPVAPEFRGEDVVEGRGGATVVRVRGPRMYSLVRSRAYHRATIRLGFRSPGVRCYAFTFERCG